MRSTLSRIPTLAIVMVTAVGVAMLATAAQADVIIRGPFGGMIVVPSSSDVQVAPGGVAVVPAPPPPVQPVPVAPLPVTPVPATVPIMPALRPVVVPGPILPQDFVRTFQPLPGAYEVTFIHPRSRQPVTASFILPQGNPRVSYVANSVLFDYGRHEVEIRFQIGGRVKVIQR
jgi:hypothetical protein